MHTSPVVTTVTTEARIHTVEYKISGTAKEALILYVDDKENMENIKGPFPFIVKFPSKFLDSQTVTLEVAKIGPGTVTGSATVDNKVFKSKIPQVLFLI